MTSQDLAGCLREMYRGAAKGDTVVQIHLFGIKYAEQIRACGSTPRDIAIAAGISETYGVEINKGMNLARHVFLREP